MSDGYPNTSLIIPPTGACRNGGIGNRILSDVTGWIQAQVSGNASFKLMAIQIGGRAMSFMTRLGAKPHSEFKLK